MSYITSKVNHLTNKVSLINQHVLSLSLVNCDTSSKSSHFD